MKKLLTVSAIITLIIGGITMFGQLNRTDITIDTQDLVTLDFGEDNDPEIVEIGFGEDNDPEIVEIGFGEDNDPEIIEIGFGEDNDPEIIEIYLFNQTTRI